MLANRVMMAVAPSGVVSYVDDYVTPYGVWSAEKKLISTYSGAAIRVRRSSDNAEQDIAFSGGLLDTAALLAFTGSNSGYVTKIYQQVAALSGADLVQATAANQPRIVNAGTLETNYAWHDGTNDTLRATLPASSFATAAATLIAKARINATATGGVVGGVIDCGYGVAAAGFGLYYDARSGTGTPGLTAAMSSGGAPPAQLRTFPNGTRNATGATHTFTVRWDLTPTTNTDASLHLYMDGSDTGQTWGTYVNNISGTFNPTSLDTGKQSGYGYYNQCGIHSIVLVAGDALAQRANIEALL